MINVISDSLEVTIKLISIASSDDDEEEKSHSVKAVRRSRGADFTTIIKKTGKAVVSSKYSS